MSGWPGCSSRLDGANLGAEDTTAALQRVVEHHHGQQRHPHADRTSPRRRRQHHNLGAVTVTVDNRGRSDHHHGGHQLRLLWRSAGSKVYVANDYDDTVSVIDTNTNNVIETISVGASPRNLAVSPNGTRVYVANL